MNKSIADFTLHDAKTVVGDERLEWLSKVQDTITELESYDVMLIARINEIYGEGFVEEELKRLYDIKDRLEYETNESFGINVTVKFSQVVEAETYEEAVEIVKDNFWNDYKLELEDFEIDPIEFDLRSVLDLLDTNGYEDASNFLQLYFAEADEEFPFVVSVLDDQNNPSDNLDSFALLEDAIDYAKHNSGTAVFKETCNTEKNTCDYELIWHPTAEQKLVKAYQKYLRQWYADHSGPAYKGMEPVCFNEFIDNEYEEEGETNGI